MTSQTPQAGRGGVDIRQGHNTSDIAGRSGAGRGGGRCGTMREGHRCGPARRGMRGVQRGEGG